MASVTNPTTNTSSAVGTGQANSSVIVWNTTEITIVTAAENTNGVVLLSATAGGTSSSLNVHIDGVGEQLVEFDGQTQNQVFLNYFIPAGVSIGVSNTYSNKTCLLFEVIQ